MFNIDDILNTILNGNTLDILKKIPNESIDMCITSPPYWKLRDYEDEGQIGQEETFQEYIDKLISIYDEVFRILKPNGSCWVNIGDVYSHNNKNGVKKLSLIGIPDRFKIAMIDKGWICRNEIIWHKPNAIPNGAKNRFNNDFEKMFFFTKSDTYYFETQYEVAKTKDVYQKKTTSNNRNCKYIDSSQEASVRQGMTKNRGNKVIEVRPNLPSQEDFVQFIRSKTSIKEIADNTNIRKTKIEHWFRRDTNGFSFPSVDDWNTFKWIINDNSQEFIDMDNKLTYIEYETDNIYKNIHKGRIKRAVWSINTKPLKKCHFAPYPEELIETPIKACCPKGGIVIDIFMGSGTTGVVAKRLGRNYIGIEINKSYILISNERIEGSS